MERLAFVGINGVWLELRKIVAANDVRATLIGVRLFWLFLSLIACSATHSWFGGQPEVNHFIRTRRILSETAFFWLTSSDR